MHNPLSFYQERSWKQYCVCCHLCVPAEVAGKHSWLVCIGWKNQETWKCASVLALSSGSCRCLWEFYICYLAFFKVIFLALTCLILASHAGPNLWMGQIPIISLSWSFFKDLFSGLLSFPLPHLVFQFFSLALCLRLFTMWILCWLLAQSELCFSILYCLFSLDRQLVAGNVLQATTPSLVPLGTNGFPLPRYMESLTASKGREMGHAESVSPYSVPVLPVVFKKNLQKVSFACSYWNVPEWLERLAQSQTCPWVRSLSGW